MVSKLSSLVTMTVPPTPLLLLAFMFLSQVWACEEMCKDGIARVFIGNYSLPVHSVMGEMVWAVFIFPLNADSNLARLMQLSNNLFHKSPTQVLIRHI